MTNSSETTEPTTPEPTLGGWMRAAAWRKRVLAHEYYNGLDATARAGISDEDYATTMATLEAMARNLGWVESQGMPAGGPGGWRGHRPHPGYGRGHGYGRGYGRGGCGERRGERSATSDRSADKASRKAEKSAARAAQAAS
jgi:hypothetical protein